MCQRISIFAQNWFCFHTTNCLHSFMCWWWLWNIEWNEIWQANLAEQKIARRKCSSSVELRVGCRQWVGIFYHSWWHTIHILNFAHCTLCYFDYYFWYFIAKNYVNLKHRQDLKIEEFNCNDTSDNLLVLIDHCVPYYNFQKRICHEGTGVIRFIQKIARGRKIDS